MPLTFEDAGNTNVRKFACFVCGNNHTNYEDYKEHILKEHAEGREYIKCPDCDFPVRCLTTHYKVKHPSRVMPTGIQTRVSIWFDVKRTKDGKPKAKKPRFRTGEFVSQKCQKVFHYRSGMEEEFYNLLEEDNDVESFFAEPFKVPYFWQGDWHQYIPDIRVNYIDGSTQLWEVKPANQTQQEQNKAKWASANNYCENVGWDFIVMTEIGLGKYRTKIKRQRGEHLLDE